MELLQFFFSLVILGIQASVVSLIFWTFWLIFQKFYD